MMGKSDIQWTDYTYNPVIGCTKVPVDHSVHNSGCLNCYAEVMHKRHLANDLQEDYTEPFNVVKILPHRLGDPVKWKKPGYVFTCSMSDLFNEHVPFHFIGNVFAQSFYPADWHIFQILTKRPERVLEFEGHFIKHMYQQYEKTDIWKDHMWLGTSVGSQKAIKRVEDLVKTSAKIKFLSCEPLLGPIDLTPYLDDIDQVIVGGEAIQGRKHNRLRPMNPEWARDIRDQCIEAGTPFFFKQHGNRRDPETGKMLSKKETGELLDGVEWKQYPVELEVVD